MCLLFCFVVFWILCCCVWKKKKNVDNKAEFPAGFCVTWSFRNYCNVIFIYNFFLIISVENYYNAKYFCENQDCLRSFFRILWWIVQNDSIYLKYLATVLPSTEYSLYNTKQITAGSICTQTSLFNAKFLIFLWIWQKRYSETSPQLPGGLERKISVTTCGASQTIVGSTVEFKR